MGKIRFENLPSLLRDMEEKEWIVESFHFEYNGKRTIAILRRYEDEGKKPAPYAKAEIEFVNRDNIALSIEGYMDFYEVHFKSAAEFFRFWGLHPSNSMRDVFKDFANVLARFIPKSKTVEKGDKLEKMVLASRTDPNDPDAIYCCDVRRDGTRKDGTLKERSTANSNKAELLRPNLYAKYKMDRNLSFVFSRDPAKERSDEEIMVLVASR